MMLLLPASAIFGSGHHPRGLEAGHGEADTIRHDPRERYRPSVCPALQHVLDLAVPDRVAAVALAGNRHMTGNGRRSPGSHELIKTLTEQTTDVITCVGPDDTFRYVSPSVGQVLGWAAEDLFGAPVEVLWHAEDLVWRREFKATMVPGRVYRFERRARRPDGTYTWCETTVRVVIDPLTEEAEMWGTLRDISERRLSGERYRLLADLCPDGVLVHDAGTIVYANPALAAMAGASSPEQLLGRTLESLVVPEAAAAVAQRARDVIERGATIRSASTVGRRLDGSTVQLEVSAAPFPLDGRTGSMVVLRDVTAARRAAELLAVSEARYRGLVENLRETAVYLFDRELRVVTAAGPALAVAEPDTLIGQRAAEVMAPGDFEQLEPRLQAALRGEASTLEYHSTRTNRHFLVDVTPITTTDGEAAAVHVVARDTTALRDSQRAAQVASERYSTAIESAPIGVAVLDLDGNYLFANHVLADLIGHSPATLEGRHFLDVAHPDHAERATTDLASIVTGAAHEFQAERRYLRADGKVVWVDERGVGVDDLAGRRERVLLFIIDVSQRVREEQLLKESEERFRLLAEAATEGVCLTEEGRLISANRAMGTMYGYDPTELVGLRVETLVAPESRGEVLRRIAEVDDSPAEYVGLRKDGSRFPVAATGLTAPYRDRQVRVATMTDLTDHKRSAALEERRRIARDLHDGLAHELAFVSSKAKALRRVPSDQKVLDELASAAERALDEARRAISVLSSAQHEPLSLVLTQTAEDLTARHNLELHIDVDAALDVSPDVAENVLRIVREAITNAGRHADATCVCVRGWRDPFLRVVVEDDGCGFEPTAVVGRFGLISMKERARVVGASFELTSAPGGGTRIELIVP